MRVIWHRLMWFVPHFAEKTVVILEETEDYVDFETLDRLDPQKGTYATVKGLFWLGCIFFISIYDYRATV